MLQIVVRSFEHWVWAFVNAFFVDVAFGGTWPFWSTTNETGVAQSQREFFADAKCLVGHHTQVWMDQEPMDAKLFQPFPNPKHQTTPCLV